jgi:hypothetical protein
MNDQITLVINRLNSPSCKTLTNGTPFWEFSKLLTVAPVIGLNPQYCGSVLENEGDYR